MLVAIVVRPFPRCRIAASSIGCSGQSSRPSPTVRGQSPVTPGWRSTRCWTGFATRLAAKVALHTLCTWLNHQFGRPDLAVATVIDW
jgi:hypothetical protein